MYAGESIRILLASSVMKLTQTGLSKRELCIGLFVWLVYIMEKFRAHLDPGAQLCHQDQAIFHFCFLKDWACPYTVVTRQLPALQADTLTPPSPNERTTSVSKILRYLVLALIGPRGLAYVTCPSLNQPLRKSAQGIMHSATLTGQAWFTGDSQAGALLHLKHPS